MNGNKDGPIWASCKGGMTWWAHVTNRDRHGPIWVFHKGGMARWAHAAILLKTVTGVMCGMACPAVNMVVTLVGWDNVSIVVG